MKWFLLLGTVAVLLLSRPAIAADPLATVSQAEQGANQPALPIGMNLGFAGEAGPGAPGWPGGAAPAPGELAALSGQNFTIPADGSFQPWNCDNCATDLANNSKGTSITSAPLSGVEIAAAGNLPASTNGTVTSTGLANAGDAAQATVEPAQFKVFCWLYGRYQASVEQPLTTDVNIVLNKVGGVVPVLVVLAISVAAIAVAYRLREPTALSRTLFKSAIVVASVTAVGLYQGVLVPLVDAVPVWLNEGFSNSSTGCPMVAFDDIVLNFLAFGAETIRGSSFLSPETYWSIGLLIVGGVVIAVGDALMAGVVLAAIIIIKILVVIGAMLLLTLLFDSTEAIFHRFIHHLIGLMMTVFTSLIIATLVSQIVVGVFGALPHTISAAATAANVFGAALAVVAIAIVLAILWRSIESIAATSGHAQLAAAAQNTIIRNAARTAQAAAGAAGGGGAANIVPFRNRSSPTPVGRSLSSGGRP